MLISYNRPRPVTWLVSMYNREHLRDSGIRSHAARRWTVRLADQAYGSEYSGYITVATETATDILIHMYNAYAPLAFLTRSDPPWPAEKQSKDHVHCE